MRKLTPTEQMLINRQRSRLQELVEDGRAPYTGIFNFNGPMGLVSSGTHVRRPNKQDIGAIIKAGLDAAVEGQN